MDLEITGIRENLRQAVWMHKHSEYWCTQCPLDTTGWELCFAQFNDIVEANQLTGDEAGTAMNCVRMG